MKRRPIRVILALLIISVMLFTACAPTPTPTPTDPGYKPDERPGEGPTPTPSGNPGYVFNDMAELMAAKDRLENADFNFDFDMSSSATNTAYSAGDETLSSGTYGASVETSGDGEFVYVQTSDNLDADGIMRGYTAFESQSNIVESASRRARELADWFIENVYAMDVAIDFSAWTYYMHHDKATDTLYIEKFLDGSEYAPESYERVTIYYDEDGTEVIESYIVDGNQLYKLVYAKDKYYELLSTFFGNATTDPGAEDEFTFTRTVAYKENGFWRGTEMSCGTGFSLFSELGSIYPDCNECILIQTFYETEQGFVNYVSNLEPRRANGEKVCGWNEDLMMEDNIKRDTDYYKFYTDSVWHNMSFLLSSYDNNYVPGMSFSLENFSGWDSIVVDCEVDPETRGGGMYYDVLEDVYLTVNGNKVPMNMWWSKTHGFLRKHDSYVGSGAFTRLSDGAILEWGDINFNETLRVDTSVTIDNDYTDISLVDIAFYFMHDGFWDTQTGEYLFSREQMTELQLQVIEAFLDANGLSSGVDGISYPRFLINAYNDGYNIASTAFEKTMGFRPDDTQALIDYCYALKAEGENFEATGRQELLDSYEHEPFSEEKMNAFKESGVSALKVDNCISGQVVVSDGNVSFAELDVSLNRSVLLSSGKSYGVAITYSMGNAAAALPVYQNQVYEGNGLYFESDASFALPTNLGPGSYVLQAYYVRQDADGAIRISDPAAVAVADFASITTEYNLTVDGTENTYTATYACVDNELHVVVDIKDVEAPEIIINGAGYDEITNTITYRFEKSKSNTVKDLLGALDIFDRVDGAIAATTDHIRLNGMRVAVNKSLVQGEIYTVVVSDARGNVATVNVAIEPYAADPSDTNPPVMTFLDGEFDDTLQAYVYRFNESEPKHVVDLFNLVNATDPECGYIPIEIDGITLNGNVMDINDALVNGNTYVITVEDMNLNVASISVYVEIMPIE